MNFGTVMRHDYRGQGRTLDQTYLYHFNMALSSELRCADTAQRQGRAVVAD